MDVINYKCPSCGAPLVFKSENQKMCCDSCESSFSIDEIDENYEEEIYEDEEYYDEDEEEYDEDEECYDEDEEEYDEDEEYYAEEEQEYDDEDPNNSAYNENECNVSIGAYECPSCAAEIIADETTAATSCPYCGNTTVLPKQFDGEFKPNWIIPFSISKEKATETLKEHYKGKRFLPKFFRNENKIQEITGVYVPFWLFDCAIEADVKYKGEELIYWSDGDYNYTRTDMYEMIRSGEIEFTGIPIDASSKIDNTLMEAIEPYRYRQLKNFSTAYLSGYLAERYDVEADDSTERVKVRIKNSVEDLFESTVSNEYTNVKQTHINIEAIDNSYEYALFPVWLLNTKYRGKIYTFAMNGQTGKFIGDLPVSKGRFLGWLAGLTAAFSIVGFLVALALASGGII